MDRHKTKYLPTLLIPITIQFGVRYLIRSGLLARLSEFTQPVIAFGWDDTNLQKEMAVQGFQSLVLPKVTSSIGYIRLRKSIHHAHFERISSCSTSIDNFRNKISLNQSQKLRKKMIEWAYHIQAAVPGNYEAMLRDEEKQLKTNTNFSTFQAIIEKIKPRAFFCLTPYFIEEEFLARAVAETQVKMSTAILSFDNLTTRPRIPVTFDQYLLWNEYNHQELLRIYPQTRQKDIRIVGTPQFDFYYDKTYLWDETVWRQRLGLPMNRPVILFGAGPESIAPPEPHWVEQIDQAIELGQITGNPIVLLRRHPVDPPDRWQALRQRAKNVVFDDPWVIGKEVIGKTNIAREDIEKLASTLYHSQVHINASSTMTIDGAIFDKPQIGPAYDDRPGQKYDRAMKELYLREHYLPITKSGGLEIAYSRDELIKKINRSLTDQNRLSDERRKMVREICTYDDGRATQRVVQALKEFLY